MKKSFTKSALIVPIAALSLTCVGMAQDDVDMTPGTPKYVVLPPKPSTSAVKPATVLPTWNGSFVYSGTTYNYNMVGTAPSSNTSTTVPVFIIPVKIVVTSSGGTTTTFDPSTVLTNGNTVTENTVTSPIYDKTTTYTQGGVDVGTSQYIDAYQRANFWGTVQTSPNYHVLFGGPKVLPEITLKPSSKDGKTGKPFGYTMGELNLNWFDAEAQSYISKHSAEITPSTLPVFLLYDVYLTDFGCCIGGYHSSVGAQAYAQATYVDIPGQFAQDVSALSHESGEFVDDPLVNNSGNPVACGILEVGDPLENNANFGAYPYTLHGFQYNLQDLVTLPYFGAPPSTSVNDWFTFQGETLSVCQNGG
ncbi:MAG: hypothetical protein ABSH50_30480 [Bryobacteraceae bacterium]|jgi:hypothetical protein